MQLQSSSSPDQTIHGLQPSAKPRSRLTAQCRHQFDDIPWAAKIPLARTTQPVTGDVESCTVLWGLVKLGKLDIWPCIPVLWIVSNCSFITMNSIQSSIPFFFFFYQWMQSGQCMCSYTVNVASQQLCFQFKNKWSVAEDFKNTLQSSPVMHHDWLFK